MKKHIQFAVVHAVHWALIYGAFVAGSEGAARVLVFFSWLLAPLAVVSMADKAVQEAAKEPASHPAKRLLSDVQAWVQLGCMAWIGWTWTAVAWFVVIACSGARRAAVDKLRAELAKAA